MQWDPVLIAKPWNWYGCSHLKSRTLQSLSGGCGVGMSSVDPRHVMSCLPSFPTFSSIHSIRSHHTMTVSFGLKPCRSNQDEISSPYHGFQGSLGLGPCLPLTLHAESPPTLTVLRCRPLHQDLKAALLPLNSGALHYCLPCLEPSASTSLTPYHTARRRPVQHTRAQLTFTKHMNLRWSLHRRSSIEGAP